MGQNSLQKRNIGSLAAILPEELFFKHLLQKSVSCRGEKKMNMEKGFLKSRFAWFEVDQ